MKSPRKISIPMWTLLSFAIVTLTPSITAAQNVIVHEVFYLGSSGNDWVELKNVSASTINVGSYWVCARFVYRQLSTLPNLDGTDLILSPGEITTVLLNFNLNNASSDLGLYTSSSFASAAAMHDFVQWGGSGIGREGVAAAASLWTAGDFAPTASSGQALAYNGGNPNGSDGYSNGAPTRSDDNNATPVDESTWGEIKALYH